MLKRKPYYCFAPLWVRFSKRSNSKQTILILHNHSTPRKPNPHINISENNVVESNYNEAYKQLDFVTAAKNKMLFTGPPKKKIIGYCFCFPFWHFVEHVCFITVLIFIMKMCLGFSLHQFILSMSMVFQFNSMHDNLFRLVLLANRKHFLQQLFDTSR